MFGHTLIEDLIIQNYAVNDSREKFDFVMASEDSVYDMIDKIDIYLQNGYITYDLLDQEQKDWVDFNIR